MMTKKTKGFTLMEMVVVIGILSIFVGLGVVAVVSFKERREVLFNARDLASLLKQVQVKASAVEVPFECDASGVSGFEVSYSGDEVGLLVTSPGGASCKAEDEVLVFTDGSEFVTAGSVAFKTPFGSANPVTIEVCNRSIQYDIEVGENGSVSEPTKSGSPGC